MALRFLEYVMIDGEQVVVYIMQVFLEDHLRCFKIEVHRTDPFNFMLCKNSANEWQVVTQTFPEYVLTHLFEPLVRELEKRLSQENMYLSPN